MMSYVSHLSHVSHVSHVSYTRAMDYFTSSDVCIDASCAHRVDILITTIRDNNDTSARDELRERRRRSP
jgi:hypothetical protein